MLVEIFDDSSLLMACEFGHFTTAKANELIVADGACPQIRDLLATSQAPVIWLDGQELSLEIVSRALAERRTLGQPINTLHWVSHGSPGQLHLGNIQINTTMDGPNRHGRQTAHPCGQLELQLFFAQEFWARALQLNTRLRKRQRKRVVADRHRLARHAVVLDG